MRDRMENILGSRLGGEMGKDMRFGGGRGVCILYVLPAGRNVYGTPLKKHF